MKPVQISAVLVASALLVALPGCEKQGPAEQAGERIDDTVEGAGDQIKKAGEAIKGTAQGDNWVSRRYVCCPEAQARRKPAVAIGR